MANPQKIRASDIDNDGDQDLFVSRLGQPNSLYRNNGEKGNWSFTDISNMAGVLEPIDSFPAWIFDYNNDGWICRKKK